MYNLIVNIFRRYFRIGRLWRIILCTTQEKKCTQHSNKVDQLFHWCRFWFLSPEVLTWNYTILRPFIFLKIEIISAFQFFSAIGINSKSAFITVVGLLVFRPGPATKLGALIILKCFLNFSFCIHHKRTVLHHRLSSIVHRLSQNVRKRPSNQCDQPILLLPR